MPHRHTHSLLTLLAAAALLPACGAISLPSGPWLTTDNALSIRSLGLTDQPPALLEPELTFNVYSAADDNTADLYLSDLPRERLIDPADDLGGLSGHLIHVHVFLIPQAGSTPISASACNITVRHLLLVSPPSPPLSDGTATPDPSPPPEAGLFGGGGFFLPTGRPGDDAFGGRILDASHRLLHRSPRFDDKLGPSAVRGRVFALRDDRIAEAVAARFNALAARVEARHAAPDGR